MKFLIIIICTKNKLILEEMALHLIEKKYVSCISIMKNIKFIHIYKKKLYKENEYKMFIKIKNSEFFYIKNLISLYKNVYMVNIYYE